MCEFFSFLTDANGKYYYFNDEQRKQIIKKELKGLKDYFVVEEPDSHSSIARYYKGNGSEDKMNKYEYCPLTKIFIKDQINIGDDSIIAETWVRSLDFKTIVKELEIKEIVNPLLIEGVYVDEYMIHLLKQWDSVRDSVCDSVGNIVCDSVGDIVGDSVGDSVRGSVCDSVCDSVCYSVKDSFRDSVWDIVCYSVRGSVWDSVWVYESSFYNIRKDQWKHCEKVDFKGCDNPFQSCIDLWELGLVPSFDGKIWRLHGGKDAKILFEITKEDLEKYGE
jgi:hypothetical protein